MRWKRILAAGILILGLVLSIASFIPANQSSTNAEQIGTQTGAHIVKFTLPLNYTDFVTFQANGYYNIANNMTLRITNQTGATEYYEPVIAFPVQAHLFNSSGEYVATFEGLETNNSTVLTVTINEVANQTIFPYFYLAFASPLIWIGEYFLLASNEKTKKLLKPIRNQLAIPITAFVIVLAITLGVSASFPSFIKVQAAIDVVTALAEVGGVMLGLCGVMFAQLFSSVMGFQNVLFEHRLSGQNHPYYEDCRKVIAERKTALAVMTSGTISFFLASIITSLISLATVGSYDPIKDSYAPFSLVALPIYCLVTAITILLISWAGMPVEPPIPEIQNTNRIGDSGEILHAPF